MALAQAANGEESPACRRYDMPAPREQKLLAANSGQHHRMSDAFYYIADTFASIEGTRTVTAADGTTHTVPLDLSQPALENYRRSLAAEDQLLSAAVRDKEKSNTLTCMGRILRSTQSYLEAERHLLRALDLNALNCDAVQQYAGMLLLMGKPQDVIALLDRFFEAAGSTWESARRHLLQGDAPWFTSEQMAWDAFNGLHSLRLFSFNYLGGASVPPLHVYQEHARWGEMIEERFKEMKCTEWANTKDAARIIKVGYVCLTRRGDV